MNIFNIFKKKKSYKSERRGNHFIEVAQDGSVTARPAEPPEEEHWGNYVFIDNPDDKEEIIRACRHVFEKTIYELEKEVFENPEKYFIIKKSDGDVWSFDSVALKVSVRINR